MDNKEYFPIDYEDEGYPAGASAYDMTGLIPSEPVNEDELDAYMDIYPYTAEEDDAIEN